jgi:putative transposase
MTSIDGIHPGHRSIRLKRRDYAEPDIYFVTICTHERELTLGRVVQGAMIASRLGEIVLQIWNEIPSHFVHVELSAFALMPNHVHGLIEVGNLPKTNALALLRSDSSASESEKRLAVVRGSLGAIVRSFKSAATKRAHGELGLTGEIWQRNYFERVVRDQKELSDTCRYIFENPLMWDKDEENPNARTRLAPGQAGAQHAAPLQRQNPL